MRALIKITLRCATILAGVGILGCSTKSKPAQSLTVEMIGSSEAPAGATGNNVPTSVELSLTALQVFAGETATALFTDSPKTVKVTNRPQAVFTADMTSYSGLSYTKVVATFDTAVKIHSKYLPDGVDMTLPSGEISVSKAFTIDDASAATMAIKIKWKNTVTRDEENNETIALPEFSAELQ